MSLIAGNYQLLHLSVRLVGGKVNVLKVLGQSKDAVEKKESESKISPNHDLAGADGWVVGD